MTKDRDTKLTSNVPRPELNVPQLQLTLKDRLSLRVVWDNFRWYGGPFIVVLTGMVLKMAYPKQPAPAQHVHDLCDRDRRRHRDDDPGTQRYHGQLFDLENRVEELSKQTAAAGDSLGGYERDEVTGAIRTRCQFGPLVKQLANRLGAQNSTD